MRRIGALTGAVACAIASAVAPAATQAGPRQVPVTIEFQAFSPYAVQAVQGDSITWSNQGGRTHTVTANDGSFDSGGVFVGQSYSRIVTQPGTYLYHCTIHRGMSGEIDVYSVTLNALPATAVAAGSPVALSGRTADPTTPVTIQSDTGAGFQTVATASPSGDGSWHTTLAATKAARVRAVAAGGFSQTRQLLVVTRAVTIAVTRRGIAVHVVPANRSALVGLQFFLRDRFGWWRVATARLDRHSSALFGVGARQPVRARVVLLGRDQWTPVAISRVVVLR